jgi:hypothetical protein
MEAHPVQHETAQATQELLGKTIGPVSQVVKNMLILSLH